MLGIAFLIVLLIVVFAVKGAASDLKKERRSPEEQHNLGVRFGNEGKLRLAFEHFQRAADMGSPQSQFNLGLFFEKGLGVRKDEATAHLLFSKAANAGLVEAQCKLGERYLAAHNEAEAITWYRRAAQNGSHTAIQALGLIDRQFSVDSALRELADQQLANEFDLDKLLGQAQRMAAREKGHKNALPFYLRAAELGSAEAAEMISFLYRDGKDVEHDFELAEYWINRAAELGSAQAHFLKKMMAADTAYSSKELTDSMSLFHGAKSRGDANCQYEVGRRYLEGDRAEMDWERGYQWLTRAAEQGHEEAIKLIDYVPF